MVRLAIVVTILILFLAGLFASLFGPAWAEFLGWVAYLATMAISVDCHGKLERGHPYFKAGGVSGRYPASRRYRPWLWSVMASFVVLGVACWLTLKVASWGKGVASGTGPVFASRAEYQLNNGGVVTKVSRSRYLVVGSSYQIGWHVLGMVFTLLPLHLVLFGEYPPRFQNPGKHKGKSLPDPDLA